MRDRFRHLVQRIGSHFSSAGRKRPLRPWLLPAILVAGIATTIGLVVVARRQATPQIPTIPYSEVVSLLNARQVSEVSVEDGGSRLIAKLRSPIHIDTIAARTVATSMPRGALSLADLERWAGTGARVRVHDGYDAPEGLIFAIASVGMFAVVLFVTQRGARGAATTTRFRSAPEDRRLTLADVGGAAEAQADLRDVIAFLKNPSRFQAMGARCPKGVLLIGPPGTGKTLLARAVAGESGCPVIVASGSEFTEMYVGVGARRVRELADQARGQAPCIVFIDEFDSVGGRRGRPNRTGEEETTLNQLLVEMDGLTGSEGVVWMAATNREDMLDPAVRRPGRFDRVVEVGMPTMADRVAILRVHASSRPLSPDVNLEKVASLTVGYSGAELANLLNEAALLAVHEESTAISAAHIEQARDRILLGRVRAGVVMSDEERRLIALHEAGHAIVGLVACPQDRLHKVTIEPRGRSLGAAHFAPDTDRHLVSRRYLEGTIAKALGGRAAEVVFLGADSVTSGAGSDLVQATSVARRMVAEFGMSEEVGLVSTAAAAQGGAPSGKLQGEVDTAVRTLIAAQAERAESIIREHYGAVEALAEALLERGVLPADDVHRIAAEKGVLAA
jgi:cell division protease FtsH